MKLNSFKLHIYLLVIYTQITQITQITLTHHTIHTLIPLCRRTDFTTVLIRSCCDLYVYCVVSQIGTDGHKVTPPLLAAAQSWEAKRSKTVEYAMKGTTPCAE